MKAIRTKEVNENVKAANSCLRKAKWQAKELAVFTGEVVRLMDKEGHSLQGFFNRVEFVLVDGTIKFRVVINPILECENCIMADPRKRNIQKKTIFMRWSRWKSLPIKIIGIICNDIVF